MLGVNKNHAARRLEDPFLTAQDCSGSAGPDIVVCGARFTPERSLTEDLIIRGKYHDGISLSIRIEKWRVFNTPRSHSALGEPSKSGGLAVECQKARLVQPLLIPAPAHWLGSLQTGELARNGIRGHESVSDFR